MYEPRRVLLISKANNFINKLKSGGYTDDGKAGFTLLYQVDTMIYGLASIKSEDWQSFLKPLKEAKYLLRTHSRDENVKRENYNKASSSILETLEKYIEYLQLELSTE